MKYAVFFRNLNLGRANVPTKPQFEAAFLAAGAETASSFLTNGTLVYQSASHAGAQRVFNAACQALQAECGLKEPGFVRTLDYLGALVGLDPFAAVDRSSVYACCVSFLYSPRIQPPPAPFESKRKDVEVLQVTPAEVLSLSRQVGNTAGSPNAFLEKLLASPLTTRNWNTVLRLVDKYA